MKTKLYFLCPDCKKYCKRTERSLRCNQCAVTKGFPRTIRARIMSEAEKWDNNGK